MTPKLKDILDLLEKTVPSAIAEDWDNTGLQVGDPATEIDKILFSLDPTLRAVHEAKKRKASLLLTHHPLLFRPLSQINPQNYPGDVIFEAIGSGISLVAVHTNLDVSPGGINDMLADLFDLQEVEILQPSQGQDVDGIGLGRVGHLQRPMRLSAMVKKVKALLGISNVKVAGESDRTIERVAVVGGSGGSLIPLAAKAGVDLLITGDIGHHEALLAHHLGLSLVDGGHFHTEKTALKLFRGRFESTLKTLGWDIPVEILEDESDPMRYA